MSEARAHRETKQVERFEAEEAKEKKSEELGGEGTGTALGKIPYVQTMLGKLANDHDLLKALHLILYKTPGTKVSRKKDIRKFNGYPAGTDLAAVKQKIADNKKWTVAVLKDVATLFGLEKSGDRDALVERIVQYLNKPYESAKTAAAPKKRKSSGGPAKKAKKAKKDGPKRTLSSYMLFANDSRAKIKESHPDLGITEIASKIGELWRGLSEAEKGKYKAKAEKLKEAAAKAQES